MNPRGLSLVAAAVCLAALAACSKHTDDSGSNGPGPTPLPPGPVTYSAIAASDGAGAGGSVPCLPFTPCTDGTGYVPVVARQLRAEGHTVTLLNMGIPGAVLSRATQDLAGKYGLTIGANYIQDEAQFVLKDSTLVTIFAGANDATRSAPRSSGARRPTRTRPASSTDRSANSPATTSSWSPSSASARRTRGSSF